MRRVLLVTATLMVAGADARAETRAGVLVVAVEGGTLDRDRVRADIARELAADVIAPEDPRAGGAAGMLDVVAKAGTLTVSYRGAARAALVRTVPLPADARRAESVVVLLAGNLARDEAAELVASLRKAKPDPKVDAFAEEVHAFEGGAKAYDDTLTSIVRAAVASKKKTELRDIDAKLAAAEERERRARDVAIVRYEHFLATWHGENAAEVEEAKTRLAALYDAAGRHEDATRLRER